MISDSIVAIITPFKHENIDIDAFCELIEWHIASGTHGIVIAGSTGEGSLLTNDERGLLIKAAIDISKNSLSIIVGCGGTSTVSVLEQVRQAELLGANAALVVAPYYVKPCQNGIFEHFAYIHANSNIPIILYNNPGRCVVDINCETVMRLSHLDRVIGIKDSNTDLSRATILSKNVKESFVLLSGDDATAAGYMAHGGHGMISVVANLIPTMCRDFMCAWREKDLEKFHEINQLITQIHMSLANYTNPVAIKYAVSLLYKCMNVVKKPLFALTDSQGKTIRLVMQDIGLLDA